MTARKAVLPVTAWRRCERGLSVGLDTQCSVKPATTTASI